MQKSNLEVKIKNPKNPTIEDTVRIRWAKTLPNDRSVGQEYRE